MTVSVVIAAYNADDYLREAIASVVAQTLPPDQVIVVVRRATSRAIEALSSFGDKVTWTERDLPAAASLNVGVAMARGDFLAFQDADDLWLPDKLARQADVLRADPGIEAVFGHMRQFVSDDVPADRRAALAPRQEVLPGVSKVTMLIRRAAFDRVGAFDEGLRRVEFVDWYARATQERLATTMLPDIVALRRLHLGNVGRVDTPTRDRENLAALHRLMTSRRAR